MMTHQPPRNAECVHCTVPTDDPSGVCSFCQDYEPPADPVELAADLTATAAQVLTTALHADQLGIIAAVDLLTALEHLHATHRLLTAHTRQQAHA